MKSRKMLVLLYPKVSIPETMPLNWGMPIFAPSPKMRIFQAFQLQHCSHSCFRFLRDRWNAMMWTSSWQEALGRHSEVGGADGPPSRIMNWLCMSTLVRYHRIWSLCVWHVWINSCVKVRIKVHIPAIYPYPYHDPYPAIVDSVWTLEDEHPSIPAVFWNLGGSSDDHPLGCHLHELQASI